MGKQTNNSWSNISPASISMSEHCPILSKQKKPRVFSPDNASCVSVCHDQLDHCHANWLAAIGNIVPLNNRSKRTWPSIAINVPPARCVQTHVISLWHSLAGCWSDLAPLLRMCSNLDWQPSFSYFRGRPASWPTDPKSLPFHIFKEYWPFIFDDISSMYTRLWPET